MRFLALAAITLMLVGCVPAEPAVTPVPVPSSTPLFASDADALAAATAAYAAYSAQGDEISAGRAEPASLGEFVSSTQLAHEISVFAELSQSGFRTVGSTTFDEVRLEKYSDAQADQFELSVYLCLDLSGIRMTDSKGIDVTSSKVPVRNALEIAFTPDQLSSPKLLVDRSEVWSGNDFCN